MTENSPFFSRFWRWLKTGGVSVLYDDEPKCKCLKRGQPMTEFGVQHTADCQWVEWFRSTGGCLGDV